MAVPDTQSYPVEPWDPHQGDLGRPHVLYPTQLQSPETPQQLISAGWTVCPHCGKSWIPPETKQAIISAHGYYTCPKCKLTSDLMEDIPWHGVVEEHYYPGMGSGGGTSVGLPPRDVGQIAENIVRQMKEIPGIGPITWWSHNYNNPLDGAAGDWGIEVKAIIYDAASHFWHPGGVEDIADKIKTAQEMGLKNGIVGILVLMNFRSDLADVYIKPMSWQDMATNKNGLVKWHKRTGVKVASNIPFESPYKDPNNPAPGPYSLEEYYKRPVSLEPSAEEMPF